MSNANPVVQKSEPKSIYIEFDIVHARAQQELVVLKEGYGKDEIVEGLKSGFLLTTTWHGVNEFTVISITETDEPIAEIVGQMIDGEYCFKDS